MESIKSKNSIPWIPLIIAAAGLAAAPEFPLLYYIVPALAAAVLVRGKRAAVSVPFPMIPALLFLPCVIGFFFSFFGSESPELSALIPSVSFLLLEVLIAVILFWGQQKGIGGFRTAAYCSAAAAALLYCSVCLPGVISGAGAFAAVRSWFEAFRKDLLTIIASAAADGIPVPSSYTVFVNSLSSDFWVSMVVPAALVSGFTIGFLNFLFYRLFIKKYREQLGIPKLTPFSRWSVPREFSTGIGILLMGSLVLLLLGTESSESVSLTVLFLVGIPLFILGLSFIDWLIVRSKKRIVLKRVIVYALCALFMQWTLTAVTMLGCFENLFHAREKTELLEKSGRFPPRPPR